MAHEPSFSPEQTKPSEDLAAAAIHEDKRFLVVGIGASAGGLEALTELLEHLPDHLGMALVFIQHLDPRHKSNLVEILARATKIPVHEATDGVPLEKGHLYVIPPDRDLAVMHGILQLMSRPVSPAQHLPIDSFFRSLADDQREQAIGVVLSGTGSDGALGLRAIKAEGGITFAQEPASAKYDGMPTAAISTGQVDVVLPPKRIAEALTRIDADPLLHPAGKGRLSAHPGGRGPGHQRAPLGDRELRGRGLGAAGPPSDPDP